MDKLKDLTKLEIKEKLLKLTPEGIHSLLEQSLTLANRDWKIFLKSLVVSKAFLNTARYHSVYTFFVNYGLRSDDDSSVSFGKGCLPKFSRIQAIDQFQMSPFSYSRIFKLTKLLDPKNFLVNLYGKPSNELLGHCETLFELVRNGKIGVRLGEWNNGPALTRLAPHLNILECHFEDLNDANVVSTLNLDYLVVYGILDDEKFKILLRHNIRKVLVYGIQIEENVEVAESEKLQVDSVLQELKVDRFTGNYKALLGFFDLLKSFSSHLRSLQVSFDFRDPAFCPNYELLETAEVLKNLPVIHEKLKALQHEVPMSLTSLMIRANSMFRIPENSTFDINWSEKLKQHEGFKNIIDRNSDSSHITFKCEYGFFTLIHHVEIEFEEETDSYGSDDYREFYYDNVYDNYENSDYSDYDEY